ncbi:uncharacterized protein C1orf189 homolog [Dendronephthya gigantea]|uniref:uncharacterized protein C1orf189 homolog n=1 Tax=Dendronephthya gigantea TaxID=151771 RepID=UPI00106D585D|nr:uncharacterized protein C1orf189 homolog [Dendronephthya gigantea]
MSMSTSYRYEVVNPSAKALKKALERQKQRIKNDEAMTQKEDGVKNDMRTILIADWVEKLEETCFKKKARRNSEEMKGELFLSNKELTAVRRAQLQNLLSSEQEQYTKELNSLEKTFHTQRI